LSVGLLTRLPVGGHYFWDLFPGFVLGGAGMGLSFVPVTIGGLSGIDRADAGVASGLINTSRQIGGAIGIAGATAIAAAATNRYTAAAPGSIEALDHGFRIALVSLMGLLIAGAAIAAIFVRPVPASEGQAAQVVAPPERALLEEAA